MRNFVLFMMLLVAASSQAQQVRDMRGVFFSAPQSLFPLLTANCRADMIDYIDAGMVAKVTNKLDGVSVLEKIDDDYLLMASTASSTIQMKLLPCGGGDVVCVVNTVKAEAADSRISFYDTEWNLLDRSAYFDFPSIGDFLLSHDKQLLDMCDISLISLTLNSDDCTLTEEYTMPEYMNTADAEKVRASLRKIVYNGTGNRFVKD